MAGDTRQAAGEGVPLTKSVDQTPTQSLKMYETFSAPPASANTMLGGTENTAGGKQEDVSLKKVATSITLEDFKKVHKQPCVRDSLLLGISGGFGLGGVRAVLGASIATASNWAVGTFVGVSFVAYEFCQYRRRLEMDGMKQAIEIIDRKKAEKQEKLRAAREERRKAKEEAEKREEEERKAQRRSGWKLW